MDSASIASLERRLKALADPTRMKIVALLEQAPRCVCEITEALSLAQPTVSRHLRALEVSGFVVRKRQGAWVIYSLSPQDRLCSDLLNLVLPWLRSDPEVVRLSRVIDELSRADASGRQRCSVEGGI